MKCSSRVCVFAVVSLVTLLATVPYYLTGRVSLALIADGLQSVNRQNTLPVSLELEAYESGLYQSRLTLLVQSRRAKFMPFFIDVDLDHNFCGTQLTIGLVDLGGRSLLVHQSESETPPELELNTECYLPALWSAPVSAQLDVPGLLLSFAAQSTQLDKTSVTFTVHDQPDGRHLSAESPDISLVNEELGRFSLRDVRLDIDAARAHESGSGLTIRVDHAEFTGIRVHAHVHQILSTLQLERQHDALSAKWHLQAENGAIDAFPYFRITNLEVETALLSEPKRQSHINMSMQQSLKLDTNYGPLALDASLEKENMSIFEADKLITVIGKLPTHVHARLPRGLMEVLFQTDMKHWLANGKIIEQGTDVSWSGEYILGQLLVTTPTK
jgi:hypothetical protein